MSSSFFFPSTDLHNYLLFVTNCYFSSEPTDGSVKILGNQTSLLIETILKLGLKARIVRTEKLVLDI